MIDPYFMKKYRISILKNYFNPFLPNLSSFYVQKMKYLQKFDRFLAPIFPSDNNVTQKGYLFADSMLQNNVPC